MATKPENDPQGKIAAAMKIETKRAAGKASKYALARATSDTPSEETLREFAKFGVPEGDNAVCQWPLGFLDERGQIIKERALGIKNKHKMPTASFWKSNND